MENKETQTIHLLISQYYEFISRFSIKPNDYYLNVVTLKEVSRRYFRDVRRLHDFHDITLIDNHKIAGYITYWISKLKPISPINTDVYRRNSETPMFINEIFAVYVAVGRINHYLTSTGRDKSIYMTDEFIRAFIYTLKYRLTTGDNTSIMYYLVEAD